MKDLLEKVLLMPIVKLWFALAQLDSGRLNQILKILTPKRFRAVIACDLRMQNYKKRLHTSDLNSLYFSELIDRKLLDALSVPLLVHIGDKMGYGHNWGYWHDLDDKKIPRNQCKNLCDYFYGAPTKRIASILEFLIDSTVGVTAPASEKEYNIFKYKEGEQFPFEMIWMLSCVHPKFLFPALNSIPLPKIKQMLRLCEKGHDGAYLESDFLHEYKKDHSSRRYADKMEPFAKHAHLLNDEILFAFLKLFHEDVQLAITKNLGEERVRLMYKKKLFSNTISFPDDFTLFVDKNSNEGILKKIQTGKVAVKSINPKKTVELLGELLLSETFA